MFQSRDEVEATGIPPRRLLSCFEMVFSLGFGAGLSVKKVLRYVELLKRRVLAQCCT